MITIIDDGREFKKNYNFQVAISLIQRSLSQVSEFTLHNCFRNCGFPMKETSLFENRHKEIQPYLKMRQKNGIKI